VSTRRQKPKTVMRKSEIIRHRIAVEKLTVAQLVKKFHAFYLTTNFITVFTGTRTWSLSWAR